MWAFEAERLGEKTVVATDCQYEAYKNFLVCKEVLESKVIPFYNISPYFLYDRLDVFFQESWVDKPYERLFDIVQHLGLSILICVIHYYHYLRHVVVCE